MRRGRVLGVAVAALAITASSCTGAKHAASSAAKPGGGAPAASSSGQDLHTTVEYSGVFDEKLHEVESGDNVVQTMDRHQHFSFRESVSLTTTAATLARPIQNTSAISDSINNPLTFQLSGTVTEHDTSTRAPSRDCSATLSGINGLANWGHPTGGYYDVRPPVEIAVNALDPSGGVAKTYGLQISAEVPTTGPHRRAIKVNVTAPEGDNDCSQTGVIDSRAVLASPGCITFAAPGPVDANFLLLPLDTEDYRKTFSCDKTLPYSQPGITGTDVVTGSSTLTINAKGAAYVALGDSFSSGDFPPFQDDTCQRSFQAFPYLYDSKVDFLACLGATSGEVAATQVPQIPANAQIISVTAGGDDVHLAGILYSCLTGQTTCGNDPTLNQQLANERSGLAQMFDAIHNSPASQAKIYILGYPDPLPPTFTRGSCPGLEHLFDSNVETGLINEDVVYLNSINLRINEAVQAAANAAGAVYVYPDPSFASHTVCSTDPWFFPLTQNQPLAQTLHPNQAGQRELEQELFAKAGPAPD